jgi:cytochrome c oxidase assembly protein subunit 15
MEMKRGYRALVLLTTCLAFIVVTVGAYVRLMDAGLGCPDWPGCYGEVSPAHAASDIAGAVAAQGGEHGPVSLRKAWKEMFHRYLAGTLGLLILAITVVTWRRRATLRASPGLPMALLALVILQAALGMWTVTLLLKPVIVTLHLLGGMATLALLVWLSLRQLSLRSPGLPRTSRLRMMAAAALAVLITQIALVGGSRATMPHWRASISRRAMANGSLRWISSTASSWFGSWAEPLRERISHTRR